MNWKEIALKNPESAVSMAFHLSPTLKCQKKYINFSPSTRLLHITHRAKRERRSLQKASSRDCPTLRLTLTITGFSSTSFWVVELSPTASMTKPLLLITLDTIIRVYSREISLFYGYEEKKMYLSITGNCVRRRRWRLCNFGMLWVLWHCSNPRCNIPTKRRNKTSSFLILKKRSRLIRRVN